MDILSKKKGNLITFDQVQNFAVSLTKLISNGGGVVAECGSMLNIGACIAEVG